MKLFASLAIFFALAQGVLEASQQDLINRRDQARGAFLSTPQGIYGHYCSHCHGDDAKGDGKLWATELSPAPTDLTTLEQDKEYVVAAIRDGSAAQGKSNLCPPWGRTLSPANLERLAQYVVSLRGEDPGPGVHSVVVSEPLPWLLLAVLLVEVVWLWRMLRRRMAGKSTHDLLK